MVALTYIAGLAIFKYYTNENVVHAGDLALKERYV